MTTSYSHRATATDRPPRHGGVVTVGRARALTAVVVTALVTAVVSGIGHSARATADGAPLCGSSWPAQPAGVAAYDPVGGLCWAGEELGATAVGIGGGNALALAASPSGGIGTLSVRELRGGTLRWQTSVSEVDAVGQPLRADGGLVVVPGPVEATVVGRDLTTGSERWRVEFASPTGRLRRLGRIVESATTVYVPTSPRGEGSNEVTETVALERATGVERWRRPSVMPALADDDVVVVRSGTGAIAFLDAASGAERWRSGPEWSHVFSYVDTQAVGGGAVFALRRRSMPGVFPSLIALDASTGAIRWERDLENVIDATMAFADGALYLSTWGTAGTALEAVDPASGAARWRRLESSVGQLVAAGDGRVVAGPSPVIFGPVEPPLGGQFSPAREALTVLDAASGVAQTVLERGPWRTEPAVAAVADDTIVVGRRPTVSRWNAPDVQALLCQELSGGIAGATASARLDLQAIPPPTAAAFVPLPPTRLFDSRDAGVAGFQCPGERLTLRVTGQASIPASGVSAVALNLTVTGAGGPGFVTAWPAGNPQPLASTLNLGASGQTRANFVVLPVAPDGHVSITTQAGGHVLADVAGYFTVSASATAGRMVPLGPQRLLDTRVDPGQPLRTNAATTIAIAGPARPAPSGAAAAIVTITATETTAPGFVTAWPTGSNRPLVSNLNLDGPNETVANLAIVPLGGDGAFSLSTSATTHLVVDLVGYVTGVGATDTSAGLFVPVLPTRVFDTRTDVGLVPAGWSVSPVHGGVAGIPTTADAALVNVTGVQPTEPAHLRVWPTGSPMPLASSLNLAPGDTRAAATLIRVGAGGRVSYWNSAGSLYLVADAMGYVLGA